MIYAFSLGVQDINYPCTTWSAKETVLNPVKDAWSGWRVVGIEPGRKMRWVPDWRPGPELHVVQQCSSVSDPW